MINLVEVLKTEIIVGDKTGGDVVCTDMINIEITDMGAMCDAAG